MVISDSLYTSEATREIKKDIIKGIKRGEFQPGLYLITLPDGVGEDPKQGNILEIKPAFTLKSKIFNKKQGREPVIVGIALGRKDSRDLVCSILGDVYKETGGFDMENYFKAG